MVLVQAQLLEQQILVVVVLRSNIASGANGGSGVVILRIPTANYSGTTTGSPTVTTGVDGTDTIISF
jgi:hypothetical protein